MRRETWLILGASSAIARAFALEAAKSGADLLLAGRDVEDLRRTAADARSRFGCQAEAIAFDATDYDSHVTLAEVCRNAPAPLNVFLAFGVMPPQADTDRDFDLARSTIEANYVGAVSVLSRLAPVLEAQGTGCLVVLGSVAGDRGRPKNYLYGSTKAALHVYLQGLRARLWRHRVRVITIKPGVVDTAMTWGLSNLPPAVSPQSFARAAFRAIRRRREVVYIPAIWAAILWGIGLIPERLFKKLDL